MTEQPMFIIVQQLIIKLMVFSEAKEQLLPKTVVQVVIQLLTGMAQLQRLLVLLKAQLQLMLMLLEMIFILQRLILFAGVMELI